MFFMKEIDKLYSIVIRCGHRFNVFEIERVLRLSFGVDGGQSGSMVGGWIDIRGGVVSIGIIFG